MKVFYNIAIVSIGKGAYRYIWLVFNYTSVDIIVDTAKTKERSRTAPSPNFMDGSADGMRTLKFDQVTVKI